MGKTNDYKYKVTMQEVLKTAKNNVNEIKKIISPFYDISTTKIYKDTKRNDIGVKVLKKTSNIKRSDILNLQ